MLNKKNHPWPDKFAKELYIDEQEFTQFRASLIKLLCKGDNRRGNIIDEADNLGVDPEKINSLARIALKMDKAQPLLFDLDTKITQSKKYFADLIKERNSEKTYIACGPKPSLLEQLAIFGISIFPGLSLGKMISTVVPIPIVAIPLGLIFGCCFFWLAEKFILDAWKNAVLAPQLCPGKEKELIKRAIYFSGLFVVADAFITGLSMVLASIPEDGEISIYSWCWLIFSIVTSIMMASVLYSCATKPKYAVRRVLNQHREKGGVAIEKITAWYRNARMEENNLKREIKDLAKDSKELKRCMADREKLRTTLIQEIFGVEYLERGDVIQTADNEIIEGSKVAYPGANVAKQSTSAKTESTAEKEPNEQQQHNHNGNGKVASAASITDLKSVLENQDSNEDPDAHLF